MLEEVLELCYRYIKVDRTRSSNIDRPVQLRCLHPEEEI